MSERTAIPVSEVPEPIINSPYAEPAHHWQVEVGKSPMKAAERRPAYYFYRVPEGAGTGRKSKKQGELLGTTDIGEQEELGQVNLIRQKLRDWREGKLTGTPYDGASRVTKELIELWRSEDRGQRLFFAQIEAAETVIFLAEAAEVYKKGLLPIVKDEPGPEGKAKGLRAFTRHACKMATGSGKTTVMGMLAAWSILNRVAAPTDDRFSDTVLIVCPNVTIRERLKELDPLLGDLSLYRTRQLVPVQRMEELRRGEVMIANWHKLAKLESNTVNGDSAKVVKTGEAVEVVKQSGKDKGKVEVKYFESDAAWFKRIRQELGTGRGRSPHWLVFNDEAHHAYRRGDSNSDDEETTLEDDKDTAKKNAKEATIWIEGLDRINKLANGRKNGINLCVDLSATPFYIQGSGNEVGKPFPWVVSDFGLLDAIESGLVKIPELPTADVGGTEEAAYFNVWRWVEAKAEEDGHGSKLTPQLVMNYASTPITLLAADWYKKFQEWEKDHKDNQRYPIPPVFIVVCRDTKVAKEVHSWLAGNEGGYGEAPEWFRNAPGREVTVRVDSKIAEEIESGSGNDEVRRMRFILDTIGKGKWPGDKVPDEWSELVRKHNDKLNSDDDEDESEDKSGLQWIDERIPPGRDIRCIVSVAMLAEGWDANTVTHIVGLRPFGSQLLCEQVVGRALRRASYVVDEDTGLFTEETAKVFGVPFELVPFKTREVGPPKEKREQHHIFSMPEREQYRIDFPIVTGYQEVSQLDVVIDWSQVAQVTIDPMTLPTTVQVGQMTAPDGSLTAFGVGKKSEVSLVEWRKLFRNQQVAFVLAKDICRQWRSERGDSVLMAQLFPKVVAACLRFLREKLVRKGDSLSCDVLLGSYNQAAIGSLYNALQSGTEERYGFLPLIPQGVAGTGSTLYVDFHTTKPVRAVTKCHLNLMVADTAKWEQSVGFLLDIHPGVTKWVKNDRLGFTVGYRKQNIKHSYIPDFIAELDIGMKLIIEVKGQYNDDADLKAKAAQRWVDAVNRGGEFGLWHYLVVQDPTKLGAEIDQLSLEKLQG
ncbi:DEAD/DEAH box helicase family protein [Pseudomonas aeruginosa]|uniref:BPTD_3080 family restriction endonuclease n=1 Tax=Pseudomonas aeruginosa TaxID=287 RepID=UPI000A512A06|nr:DEAD/DEAH box helicase family protein [Pseudomonas aeruginosa]